jgi:hypothetical protein
MRKLTSLLKGLTLAAAVLLVAAVLIAQPWRASAQVPSLTGPYNIDLGKVLAFTNLLNTASAQSPAGSTYSTTPVNYSSKGLICSLTITGNSASGSPSLAWSIQQYDAASNSWFTLVTQTIVGPTGSGIYPAPAVLEVAPGIAVSSLPTNLAAANLVIPRIWRVNVAPSGSVGGTYVSGYVGCNLVNG